MSGGIPSDVRPEIRQTSGGDPTPTLDPTPSQEVAIAPSSPPPAEKQRVRDPLSCRMFIENFNQAVRKLGGAPALNQGLDPFRANEVVERCRAVGMDPKAVIVAWFTREGRTSYTLDALAKASSTVIEQCRREEQPQP